MNTIKRKNVKRGNSMQDGYIKEQKVPEMTETRKRNRVNKNNNKNKRRTKSK